MWKKRIRSRGSNVNLYTARCRILGGVMNKMMILIIGILLLITGNVYAVDNAGDINLDPNYLNLKVYQFSVSTSPLCTDPIILFEDDSPSFQDVLAGPDFGAGQISDGTYPCVIIEFSDNIQYQPSVSSTTGQCNSSTPYTLDVCSSGTSTMTDGSTTTCDSSENRVAMYLSTASTSTTGVNAFDPPSTIGDASNGFNLASALVVSGAGTGKFVVNATDKICDSTHSTCSGATCEMAPPLFSFTKL
jgi:hypothetical protein